MSIWRSWGASRQRQEPLLRVIVVRVQLLHELLNLLRPNLTFGISQLTISGFRYRPDMAAETTSKMELNIVLPESQFPETSDVPVQYMPDFSNASQVVSSASDHALGLPVCQSHSSGECVGLHRPGCLSSRELFS